MDTFYYISLITFTLYIMGVVATKGVPKSVYGRNVQGWEHD